jgi:hypothetical protein
MTTLQNPNVAVSNLLPGTAIVQEAANAVVIVNVVRSAACCWHPLMSQIDLVLVANDDRGPDQRRVKNPKMIAIDRAESAVIEVHDAFVYAR